jgi:ribosomal protein S12 methylthiotransferase
MTAIRVYFSPVACPKANVDLEKAAWRLSSSGMEIVGSADGADFVVVFCCGFIDDAKREAVDDILTYATLKQSGRIRGIVVAGCLPQKYGEELAKELPEIDLIVGNAGLDRLGAALEDLARGATAGRVVGGGALGRGQVWTAGSRHPALDRPWSRVVMVCDGCDNACTYCAIPHMRGPLASRRAKDILDETRVLVAQGAKEIVVAGQDTASYGLDRGAEGLADLMAEIAAKSGAHWVRLAYANPENLNGRLGAVMARHPNVCHYVDMPVQHASPRVLAAMGRRKPIEATLRLIDDLRRQVPDVALRTSVIVGFPGETESDFRLLLFLKGVGFDMAGAFVFSPQPGTPAATLPGRVPTRVAEERLVEVTGLQDEIGRARAEALVGRTLEVLVETRGSGEARGRLQYDMADVDRTVSLSECKSEPGQFVLVRVDSCLGSDELAATCV